MDSDVPSPVLRIEATAEESSVFPLLKALVEALGVLSGSFWRADTNTLVATLGKGPDSDREALLPEALSAGLICIPVFQESVCLGSFVLTPPPSCVYSPGELTMATEFAQKRVQLAHQASQNCQVAVLEERNNLACEIHDGMAQYFAGILLQLGVAQRLAKQQPDEAWKLVAQAETMARTAGYEARRSLWSLQAAPTGFTDLSSALSSTVAQMTVGIPVEVSLQIHGVSRFLPPFVGMNLLRIGQEALNNALHHAQAEQLAIDLKFDTCQVQLSIRDDGLGFDLQNQGVGGGFGLIGMRQRTERIGGKLVLRSQPGQGTEVVVTVPFASLEGSHES